MRTPHSSLLFPPPGSDGRPGLWIALGAALAAVGVRAVIACLTGFTNEDALITLRYAENLAAGRGFVYNPGEPVLGTTTPLYTLFLALGVRLGLPALATGKVVCILADGGLCLAAWAWGRAWGREDVGRLAAVCVAAGPLHIRWAISGMETSLVALGCALVWLAWFRGRERTTWALLALLFLLRWDTAVLALLLLGGSVVRERRAPWRGLGLFLVLVLPWLVFSTLEFGSPLPGTARAKWIVYSHSPPGTLFPASRPLWLRVVTDPAYAVVILLAVSGVACGRGGAKGEGQRAKGGVSHLAPPLSRNELRGVSGERGADSFLTARNSFLAGGGLPLLWVVGYYGLLAVSPVPVFEWYLVPPLLVVELAAAAGCLGLLRWVCGPDAPYARRSGSVPAFLVPFAVRLASPARRIVSVFLPAVVVVLALRHAGGAAARTQAIENRLRRPLGLWLRQHARPGDRVMLEPIGYIGYYSGLRVLDVVGLVSPEVLPFWRHGAPGPLWELARAFRPEWCVLRPTELLHIRRAGGEPWEQEYRRETTFSYRRAGDPEPFTFHVYRRAGTGLPGGRAGRRPLPVPPADR